MIDGDTCQNKNQNRDNNNQTGLKHKTNERGALEAPSVLSAKVRLLSTIHTDLTERTSVSLFTVGAAAGNTIL